MAGERLQSRETEPQTIEEQAMLVIGRPDVLDMEVPHFPGCTGRAFLNGYSPEHADMRALTERKLKTIVAMTPQDEGYDKLYSHIAGYIETIFGPAPSKQ